ncbi:o-succinylbenzoate synthase [Virgibacillus xinjiangensis]|uniref:o-succinylbenzoate synthase n=1 Tax=Virgibacillus xinjiangensis TaxID=393090 RepID=A0ABV7CQS4_9BACI
MVVPIREINMKRLRMRLKHPFATSFGTMEHKEFFLLEAKDGEGNSGFGESAAFTEPWYTEETVETTRHMLEDFLIPILQKNQVHHPDEVTELFRAVRRNNMAKAAIEGAVWDLSAKREGLPLSRALGGEKRKIDVGVSIGIQPSVKDTLDVVERYLREGYKRLKLKIKPGWDIDVLREVRRCFPEAPIMADANSAYTLEDIDHLRQLDDLELLMVEQPLGADDIIDHANLQAAIRTPICLDESITSLEDATKAVELGSCKVVNLKISRVGGLTEARRIHDYCQEQGIAVWCGGMLEAGVGRAHNIALTTLPQFVLPGDTSGSSRYWEKDIIQPEVTATDGEIVVPEQPGIGFQLDEEAVRSFTVEEKTFDF